MNGSRASTRWRRELGHRVDEARARTMVRVARRTLKKRPNRLDRLATRVVAKATADR